MRFYTTTADKEDLIRVAHKHMLRAMKIQCKAAGHTLSEAEWKAYSERSLAQALNDWG